MGRVGVFLRFPGKEVTIQSVSRSPVGDQVLALFLHVEEEKDPKTASRLRLKEVPSTLEPAITHPISGGRVVFARRLPPA